MKGISDFSVQLLGLRHKNLMNTGLTSIKFPANAFVFPQGWMLDDLLTFLAQTSREDWQCCTSIWVCARKVISNCCNGKKEKLTALPLKKILILLWWKHLLHFSAVFNRWMFSIMSFSVSQFIYLSASEEKCSPRSRPVSSSVQTGHKSEKQLLNLPMPTIFSCSRNTYIC